MSHDHGAEQDENQREGGEKGEGCRDPIVDVDALGVGTAHGACRSRGFLGRRGSAESPTSCPFLFLGLAGLLGRSGALGSLLLLLELIVPRLELVGKRLAVLLIVVGHALVSLLCSIRVRRLAGAGIAVGEGPHR